MSEIKTGIENQKEVVVTDELTAAAMGSGLLPVFATPCLVALMEETCHLSVGPFLEEGQGTVGTKITVEHTAATPIGMTVTCKSRLVEASGRKLVFEVEAFDEAGSIGTGTHERFIIDNERFMEKASKKGQK